MLFNYRVIRDEVLLLLSYFNFDIVYSNNFNTCTQQSFVNRTLKQFYNIFFPFQLAILIPPFQYHLITLSLITLIVLWMLTPSLIVLLTQLLTASVVVILILSTLNVNEVWLVLD